MRNRAKTKLRDEVAALKIKHLGRLNNSLGGQLAIARYEGNAAKVSELTTEICRNRYAIGRLRKENGEAREECAATV